MNVARRADRLDVALFVTTVTEPPRAIAQATFPHMTLDDFDALMEIEDEDVALALSCVEVERELRDREFAALEKLLALIQWQISGNVVDRVMQISDRASSVAALRASYRLGWLSSPPVAE